MSSQNNFFGTLPICVERHLHPNYSSLSDIQRAAFITSTLWDIGTTLTVGFYPLSAQGTPQWYTIDQLKQDVPSGYVLDPIEYEVRKISSIPKAIQYVITNRLQPFVNVKFKWIDNVDEANVRINFDVDNGAWSYVGRQITSPSIDGQPTMNFAWLDTGTFIHEFCHTLGMIHEHQNPYGRGIQWNLPLVYKWALKTQGWDQVTTYNNILKKYDQDTINGSDYDPLSIMLYFYPAYLTTDGVGTTENHQLSSTDKLWLSSIYPQSGQRVFPQLVHSTPSSILGNTPNGTPTDTRGFNLNIDQQTINKILVLSIFSLILYLLFRESLNTIKSKIIFVIILVLIFYIVLNKKQ